MLISIDSPLQILILDNFVYNFFLSMQPLMIVELKEKCTNTINDKLATFPASLQGDFIEKARTAVIGENSIGARDCATITRNP